MLFEYFYKVKFMLKNYYKYQTYRLAVIFINLIFHVYFCTLLHKVNLPVK